MIELTQHLSREEYAQLELAASELGCTPEEWATACLLTDLMCHRTVQGQPPPEKIALARKAADERGGEVLA